MRGCNSDEGWGEVKQDDVAGVTVVIDLEDHLTDCFLHTVKGSEPKLFTLMLVVVFNLIRVLTGDGLVNHLPQECQSGRYLHIACTSSEMAIFFLS